MACYIGVGAATALAGAVIYANLPTRLTIGAVVPTAKYLAQAKLIKVDDEAKIDSEKTILAGDIFAKGPTVVMAVRRPGCILCRREAGELSTLKSDLDNAGVQLIAVVHESKGVNDFKPYFKGDVYFDKERHFYGPNERWLPLWVGFLRPETYYHVWRAKKESFAGNTEGEGRLLGGVYFVNKGEMIWSHLEQYWGDKTNIDEFRQALNNFRK